jgi:hypothetical protein
VKGTIAIGTSLVFVMASLACTNYHAVSPSSYAELEPSPKHGYRVSTLDNSVYVVKKLTVRDSTLVAEGWATPPGASGEIPVEIPIEQVRSVERIEKNYASPIVLSACVAGLIVAFASILGDIPAMD